MADEGYPASPEVLSGWMNNFLDPKVAKNAHHLHTSTEVMFKGFVSGGCLQRDGVSCLILCGCAQIIGSHVRSTHKIIVLAES